MKTTIETLRSGLESQLSEIDREITTTNMRQQELKSVRKQVASALRALGGGDRAGTRPAPKKAQVRAAVQQLLANNDGSVAAKDLESLVAEHLANAQGCSAVGLALRLREVLGSDEFQDLDGEIRQARQNKTPS